MVHFGCIFCHTRDFFAVQKHKNQDSVKKSGQQRKNQENQDDCEACNIEDQLTTNRLTKLENFKWPYLRNLSSNPLG